jgi:hypothetical protein
VDPVPDPLVIRHSDKPANPGPLCYNATVQYSALCNLHRIHKYRLRGCIQRRYSVWLQAGRSRARSSSHGRVKNVIFSLSSRTVLGPTQLPSNEHRRPFSWVKQPGRDANHSPPTNVEVEKTWIYTSTSPCAIMA